MRDGRVVEADRTEALFRARGHPYTRKLFASSEHVPVRAAKARDGVLLSVEGVTRSTRCRAGRSSGPRPRFTAVDG
jgi:peptide/nickel transport system ATP-binding protein